MRLDPRRRTATLAEAGIEIDAGGIAKGYAADEAIRVLRAHGCDAALVAIGGDIAAGDAAAGTGRRGPWRFPCSVPTTSHFDRRSCGAAVSTSGDAEQWMTVDGVRRSHVIDLRTGWPITGRRATSVVAAHGIDADAVSTALDVLDDEAGARLLRTVPGPGDPRHATAQALWQRLEAPGPAISHHSLHWPAIARPISAITLRGTP